MTIFGSSLPRKPPFGLFAAAAFESAPCWGAPSRQSRLRIVPSLISDDTLVETALKILSTKVVRGDRLESPSATRQYLSLRFANLEHEVFSCLWLDNRHRVIACDELFRGTIDGASVHPREVVKRALAQNAAAVILAHNHPSGVPEPSQADELITHRLKDALAIVDIRVLDHLIVAGAQVVSMAERGVL